MKSGDRVKVRGGATIGVVIGVRVNGVGVRWATVDFSAHHYRDVESIPCHELEIVDAVTQLGEVG